MVNRNAKASKVGKHISKDKLVASYVLRSTRKNSLRRHSSALGSFNQKSLRVLLGGSK